MILRNLNSKIQDLLQCMKNLLHEQRVERDTKRM